MIIIIDGYNVIRQLHKGHSEDAKQRFIKRIIQYSNDKKHQIMVVFDGGDSPYEYHEQYDDVRVTYSGYKQTADDIIKKLLVQKKGHDVLLVSSDRELVDAARHNNIDSSDALAFYHIVQSSTDSDKSKKTTVRTGEIVRKSETDDQELARIMEESSRTMPVKSEDIPTLRKREGRVLSKQEKRLLRKVKKL